MISSNTSLIKSEDVINEEVNTSFEGLRLAVAITIIKLKPPNQSASSYAEQLYSMVSSSRKKKLNEDRQLNSILMSLKSPKTTVKDPSLKKPLFTDPMIHTNMNSSKKIQFIMSVASLNKFNKVFENTSILQKELLEYKDRFFQDIDVVVAAVQEQISTKSSDVAVDAGLQQICKIANNLEKFSLQKYCEGIYKMLLSYILNKITTVTEVIQMFILECTSFEEYFNISSLNQILLTLSQNSSIFISIVKQIVRCIKTTSDQFACRLRKEKIEVTSSNLNVCLFTNIGYLLQMLHDILSNKILLLDEWKIQTCEDAAKNNSEKATERKNILLQNEDQVDGSLQAALVFHNSKSNLLFLIKNLNLMSCLVEQVPLLTMFASQCQMLVEQLVLTSKKIIDENSVN